MVGPLESEEVGEGELVGGAFSGEELHVDGVDVLGG